MSSVLPWIIGIGILIVAVVLVLVFIVFADNEPPTITSPDTVDLYCSGDLKSTIYTAVATDDGGSDIVFRLTDGSSIFSISGSDVKFINEPHKNHSQTFSFTIEAEDKKNNTASKTVKVNLLDDIPPIFSSPDIIEVKTSSDLLSTIYKITTSNQNNTNIIFRLSTGSDVFSIMDDEISFKNGANLAPNIYTFSIEAEDSEGNTSSKIVQVKLIDDTPPEFKSPNSKQILISEIMFDTEVYKVVATDNTGSGLTYMVKNNDYFTLVNDSPDQICFKQSQVQNPQSGIFKFIVVVEDSNRNTSQMEVTITVVDDIPPTITSSSVANTTSTTNYVDWKYTIEATDNVTASADLTYALDETNTNFTISTDGIVTFETTPSVGVHEFTVGVRDEANNSQTKVVTVSVNDDTKPEITSETQADNASTSNYTDWQYEIKATDNVTASADLTYALDETNTNFIISTDGIVTFKTEPSVGVHEFTVGVSDEANNTQTKVVKVSVNDDTEPEITSSTQADAATASNYGDWKYTITATDNVTAPADLTYALDETNTNFIISTDGIVTFKTEPSVGVHEFTVGVSDEANNTQTQNVTVTVT